ncbi:YraN family protein [uncultured Roseobacter sp.]|uniref:YraN family protein n=1 Tax=uncultured Roseobacter sp. TaxID=114847 RepID=UPI002629B32F|nr:YraN family protein [uncultured Roseobacter sp.]
MAVQAHRVAQGQTSYLAGSAAEDAVARHYRDQGYAILESRWRGEGGEIDLIVQNDAFVVFVEVKQSKRFAQAATRISARQMQRIHNAAGEYLGQLPMGLLTDARFDVALVDGQGAIQIIENAFAEG